MSALQPPEPTDTSWVDTVLHYAPIGAVSAAIRFLLSDKPETWGYIIRHILAASLTAWIAGPAVDKIVGNQDAARLAIGAVAYASPHVWDILGRQALKVLSK